MTIFHLAAPFGTVAPTIGTLAVLCANVLCTIRNLGPADARGIFASAAFALTVFGAAPLVVGNLSTNTVIAPVVCTITVLGAYTLAIRQLGPADARGIFAPAACALTVGEAAPLVIGHLSTNTDIAFTAFTITALGAYTLSIGHFGPAKPRGIFTATAFAIIVGATHTLVVGDLVGTNKGGCASTRAAIRVLGAHLWQLWQLWG